MPTLRAQTLARAAQIVGSVDALAEALAIPAEMLARYIRQESTVPMEVFLRASEIVTTSAVSDAARPSPQDPAIETK